MADQLCVASPDGNKSINQQDEDRRLIERSLRWVAVASGSSGC